MARLVCMQRNGNLVLGLYWDPDRGPGSASGSVSCSQRIFRQILLDHLNPGVRHDAQQFKSQMKAEKVKLDDAAGRTYLQVSVPAAAPCTATGRPGFAGEERLSHRSQLPLASFGFLFPSAVWPATLSPMDKCV